MKAGSEAIQPKPNESSSQKRAGITADGMMDDRLAGRPRESAG